MDSTPPQPSADIDESQTQPLVLVVEDDLSLARLLEALLESAGYASRLVGDGHAALDAVRGEHPVLVLLDLSLPRMDGWEVLERLRALDNAPPVVLLTGHVNVGRRATRAGAAAVVLKPFDVDDLLATVERLVGDRGQGTGDRE